MKNTTNKDTSATAERQGDWVEEFERLMPKTSGETMSYPQFCAVRSFVADLLSHQEKALRERVVEIVEKTIQEERFSGAPHALNKVLKALSDI